MPVQIIEDQNVAVPEGVTDELVSIVADAIDPGAWSVNIPNTRRKAVSTRQARRVLALLYPLLKEKFEAEARAEYRRKKA
jgi:hypothetical protein